MLYARFSAYVASQQLYTAGDRLLLALSGGADSCVLAYLLKQAGCDFAVAHINHGLRGAESDADALFCRELAEQYNVSFFETRFSDLEETIPADESLQSHARNRRYAFLQETAAQNGFTHIVTGHHLDDRIETFFIHLLRGSGVSGLRSILPKHGNIIRPLLFATRESIETYAIEKDIAFRNDSSNAGDAYLRNKIRHHLIPVLHELNPAYVHGFETAFENLRDTELLLDELLPAVTAPAAHETAIPVSEWISKPGAATRLYHVLRPFGYEPATCRQLVLGWDTMQSGSHFFSAGYELLRNRDELLIRPKKAKEEITSFFISPEEVSPLYTITFLPVPFQLPGETDPHTAYFDAAGIRFPLQVRPWKTGDRMIPLGMNSSKKLSDIFIDKKCSLFEKERAQVVVCGEEIIWVPGICYGQTCRITGETQKVLQLTFNKTTA